MTYWELNAIFLGSVAIIALLTVVLRRPPVWSCVAVSAAMLLVLTAFFDNAMIAAGLVGYNESLISGVFVGIAPLEDLAYSAAAIVLLPSLWTLLGGKHSAHG